MTHPSLEVPFPAPPAATIPPAAGLPTASRPAACRTTLPPFQFRMPILWPDDTTEAYLIRELSVRKLNNLVGRTGNVRPLHRQRIIGRKIVITEKPDLHLVWDKAALYVKPLPHFLFDHAFFTEHLTSTVVPDGEASTLHASACGLLRTYTLLIEHPSDFHIAMEEHLLPSHLDWDAWCTFSGHLRTRLDSLELNQRYQYGELRATRLDIIFRVLRIDSRGFHYVHTRYASLFRQHFGWLLLVFVYVTLVLTALQTLQSSRQGMANEAVQDFSWWFCVLSLLAVAGALLSMVLVFVINFVSNYVATMIHIRKRDKLKKKKMNTGPQP
ncbi:hypothetical protein Q9L58_010113 [Maublancomyces gigas]|uniref:Subtilisin-like serine protease n=1 Tax=Discina gigas TaxID=1032678 RepID=A0ABR3G507_9PEZI